MLRIRILALLTAALLTPSLLLPLAACGGGGGGGGPTSISGGSPGPAVGPLQLSQDLLSECGGAATVQQIQAVTALYQQVAAGQGGAAGFTVLTGQIQNSPGLIIPWELDLDGDQQLDGSGSFVFEDAAGQPSVPFTPTQMAPLFTQGIAGLGVLMAAMPDGTQLILVITELVGPPSVSGQVRASFTGGQPTLFSGDLSVSEGTCGAQSTWNNVPVTAFAGAFPSAVFNLRVTQASDVLLGTLTTDGTNTAVASVSLNAGATTAWDVNLTTGAVTQNP